MPGRSLRPFRVKVAQAYRGLGEKGLITGSSGNVSLRVGEVLLITPTGVPWERLRARAIVALDLEGRVRGRGFPSSEWRLHVAIYRARPEVRAVVHTHSPCATAVACASRALPVLHDEGRMLFGEAIPVAEAAPPGTWELARNAAAALGSGPAVLLARHGVVTVGETLASALLRAEKAEEAARLLLVRSALAWPPSFQLP
ncbi:MAG: class II aldolase/adducin family protein [Candidatus Bipolaricaulota bacterium]|nr:class II aldolase/adducin family protein [Candidatus Bipolaricaulota bacterium]MDW8152449.1 class II aldolase/adducin family protein [Candidatus Bipolaricaulota bacterium]